MPDMNQIAPPAGQPQVPPQTGAAAPGGAPNQPPGQPQGVAPTTPQGANVPPEMEQRIMTLAARGKQILYGDPENFENMMGMIERGGEEGFPKTASTAVNTILDRLEQEEGEQEVDILAAAGAIILGSIAEDLTVGGAINVTPELFNKAAAKAMNDWMSNHPERVDGQAVMAEMAALQGQEGVPGQVPSTPGGVPGQVPSTPSAGTRTPPAGTPESYLGGAQ